MKKMYKFFVILMLLALLLPACTPKPAAVVAPTDLKAMTWDQIVAQAKTEKDLVFYAWWGEDFLENSRHTIRNKIWNKSKCGYGR